MGRNSVEISFGLALNHFQGGTVKKGTLYVCNINDSQQGQQGLGRRSADVEHVELHDVPAHKRQVSTNAQDYVGMRDTMVMPREERDCSQTQGAGSILNQYGNSASMQSTAASPPHYVPPTPR